MVFLETENIDKHVGAIFQKQLQAYRLMCMSNVHDDMLHKSNHASKYVMLQANAASIPIHNGHHDTELSTEIK